MEDKFNLLKGYEEVNGVKTIKYENLKRSEKHPDIIQFKYDYMDFNPLFKEPFNNWEFGNLNDDEIDQLIPCQKLKEKIMRIKVIWKKRKDEEKPRKPRYYPYYVIQIAARNMFNTLFYSFHEQ